MRFSKLSVQTKPFEGLPVVPYFAGTKARWIIDNIDLSEQLLSDTLMFGTIDSWLVWNLTGGVNGGLHITDVTNASRTLLMNIDTLQWDEQLCDVIGIPMAILPEIRCSVQISQHFSYLMHRSCSEVYGTCSLESLKGVPIAGILGDQQAALFGQACFSPGMAKNTYGTGCFLLMNTGKRVQSANGMLSIVAYKIGDEVCSQQVQPCFSTIAFSLALSQLCMAWKAAFPTLVA